MSRHNLLPIPSQTLDSFKSASQDPRMQASLFGELANGKNPELEAASSSVLNLIRGQGTDRALNSLEAFTMPGNNEPFNAAMNRPFTQPNQESFEQIMNVFNSQIQDPSKIQDFNQFRSNPEGTQGTKIGRHRFFKADDRVQSGNGAEIQRLLKSKGFDPGTIDGFFGKKSKEALRQFQKSRGLKVDGILGPNSMRELYAR